MRLRRQRATGLRRRRSLVRLRGDRGPTLHACGRSLPYWELLDPYTALIRASKITGAVQSRAVCQDDVVQRTARYAAARHYCPGHRVHRFSSHSLMERWWARKPPGASRWVPQSLAGCRGATPGVLRAVLVLGVIRMGGSSAFADSALVRDSAEVYAGPSGATGSARPSEVSTSSAANSSDQPLKWRRVGGGSVVFPRSAHRSRQSQRSAPIAPGHSSLLWSGRPAARDITVGTTVICATSEIVRGPLNAYDLSHGGRAGNPRQAA